MPESLKNFILDYLKGSFENDKTQFINGGTIEDLARNACGRKASNASRRLRELENEGKIEVRYNAKHHAEYRYVEQNQNLYRGPDIQSVHSQTGQEMRSLPLGS